MTTADRDTLFHAVERWLSVAVSRYARHFGLDFADLFQDTAALFLQKAHLYDDGRGMPTTFADAVARTAALRASRVRKRARRTGKPVAPEVIALRPAPAAAPEAEPSPALARGLAALPARDREVVELRFGLRGRDPLQFQQIGARLGVSYQRADQLYRRSLAKLARVVPESVLA